MVQLVCPQMVLSHSRKRVLTASRAYVRGHVQALSKSTFEGNWRDSLMVCLKSETVSFEKRLLFELTCETISE